MTGLRLESAGMLSPRKLSETFGEVGGPSAWVRVLDYQRFSEWYAENPDATGYQASKTLDMAGPAS